MKILYQSSKCYRSKSFICLCLSMFPYFLLAQSVVISKDSEANPEASAILDVQSTDQGMLVPRMTNEQRDNIENQTVGLLIYQTDATPGFYYYDGENWVPLKSTGITIESDPEVGDNTENYIPKWDGNKLISGSIYDNGNVGIGINNPSYPLHVNGSIRSESYIETATSLFGNYLSINGGGSFSGEVNVNSLYSNGIGWFHSSVYVKGPNSNNINISSVSGYPDHGWISVDDASGNWQAGMYVDSNGDGYIFSDNIASHLKNFVEEHPLDPTKEIVYACIEGPEAAMYMRGTTELVNGKAMIALPEHYRVLAVESTMTVLVTPLSANSKGLAVTAKSLNGIAVEELMQGDGSYGFDWEVKCVRKGYEDYQVVREKLGAGDMSTAAEKPMSVPVYSSPERKQP